MGGEKKDSGELTAFAAWDILEQMSDGFLALDGDLRILTFNGAAERILGRRREDVVGRRLVDAFPEARGSVFETEYTRAVREKRAAVFETFFDVAPYANWYEVRVHPFEGGISVFFQITTERKRAEKALRESEERYRTLIEQASDGIFLADQEGRYIDVNSAGCRMLGYTRQEILQRTMSDLTRVPRDNPLRLNELRQGKTLLSEREMIRKDGTPVPVEISAKQLPDGLLQGIVRDITERSKAEQALREAEKFKALGQLAGGIAHQFNNKMSVVLAYADSLLGDLPPDSPLRGDVQEIQNAGRHAAELTRQLLSVGRKQMLEVKTVNLNDVVMGLGRTIAQMIGGDVELTISLDPHLADARADESQIEEAVLCLVRNANDAMPRGGRLVTKTENAEIDEAYCRMVPEAKPGRYVALSVQDTGTGMTREVLDHLFEPFFTTKGLARGTGLALSAVHGMVKQTGGWISVTTEPGKGSTFRIFLPVARIPGPVDISGMM